MLTNKYLIRFNTWGNKKGNQQVFIISLSIVIGIFTGIAAALMKTAVIVIKDYILKNLRGDTESIALFLLPIIGISLTLILLYFVLKDPDEHGIKGILRSISQRKGKIKHQKIFSSFLGGTLTSAFGGSAGLESPIITTGTSFSSVISSIFKLNFKQTSLLIGCGAAAAMSGIFFTPIAAIIFVVEIFIIDLTANSIIPLLIASITGAIVSSLIMPAKVVFQFSLIEQMNIVDMPFLFFLGILTGLISFYYKRMTYGIHLKLRHINPTLVRIAISLSFLGILVFVFPSLYGEGYDTLMNIINGNAKEITDISFFYQYRDEFWILTALLLAIAFLKVISTSLTIESGGVGGFFAPSVFTGGMIGYVYSSTLNHLFPHLNLTIKEYTIVGMAGVLAGVMHAPLTAIFFAAEITQGYILILPLMLVSTIAFLTSRYFEKESVFTIFMNDKDVVLTHHKDKTVLSFLSINNLIDKDLTTIPPNINLEEFTDYIAKSKRNVFPVVNEKNEFLGVVDIGDLRADMFNKELYNKPITDYMIQPTASVSTQDKMETAMEKFNETGYYNLPVIDNKTYIGFISRSNTFSAYRKMLLDVSQD
jgi:CIC family chloride channel protein